MLFFYRTVLVICAGVDDHPCVTSPRVSAPPLCACALFSLLYRLINLHIAFSLRHAERPICRLSSTHCKELSHSLSVCNVLPRTYGVCNFIPSLPLMKSMSVSVTLVMLSRAVLVCSVHDKFCKNFGILRKCGLVRKCLLCRH